MIFLKWNFQETVCFDYLDLQSDCFVFGVLVHDDPPRVDLENECHVIGRLRRCGW